MYGGGADGGGLAELAELVDRCRKLAGAEVSFSTDDELCDAAVGLTMALRALESTRLHVVAELDARGATDRDAGLRTGAWLAATTREPQGSCRATVRMARQCRTLLPEVDEALAEGRISTDHARAIVAAANPRIATELAQFQSELIARAALVPFRRWQGELGWLVELLDQDGGHDPAGDEVANRAHIASLGGGVTRIVVELFGENSLVAVAALETEADALFHRYQRDREQCSDVAIPPRSTLLALGLVSLLRKGLARDVGSSEPPRPEVIIVERLDEDPGTDTPKPELTTTDGTPVDQRFLHALLCDPLFRSLLIDGDGVPLRLGRAQRRADGQLRRALTLRDGGCVFPGCDAPANWCDSHHVVHWLHGGHTDLDNLALLCRHHHGVTHRHGWTMTASADQWFRWTTPRGQTIESQRHGQQRAGP